MTSNKEIPYYDILKINGIFKKQGWPQDESNKNSLYNRFIQTYCRLDDLQKELYIKLSSMYRWIPLSQYQELTVSLIKEAVQKFYLKSKQNVWVYPIKKSKHLGSVKSSDLVAYLCKSLHFKYDDVLCKKKFCVLGSIEAAKEHIKAFKTSPLLIVDDYIGTGRYASEVVEELIDNGIPKDNIVICSLFISVDGLKNLSKTGLKIVYMEKITGVIEKLSKSEKELLSKIEDILSVDEQFRLGFGGTGALITLIRTPNNTLPLFWFDKGRSHTAPFPR